MTPRVRRRYGRHYGYPVRRAVLGSLVMLVGGGALALLTRGFADHADLVGAVVGTGLALRGGYRLVRLGTDRTVTVTGEVLLVEPWRVRGRTRTSPGVPWVYRLALDDGGVWAVPKAWHFRCRVGTRVRVTGRRWSRYVERISPA